MHQIWTWIFHRLHANTRFFSNYTQKASQWFILKKKTNSSYIQDICFFSSVHFSSVAQSCPTLCDHMNRSTPGIPVLHHLLEFTQTHVHQVSDAIQPSHPLSSPSPPAPNPSLLEWPKSQNTDTTKCWQGCRAIGTHSSLVGVQMVQLLWKTPDSFLQN